MSDGHVTVWVCECIDCVCVCGGGGGGVSRNTCMAFIVEKYKDNKVE